MGAKEQTILPVREVERSFLRRGWWLFPLAGVGISLLMGGPFWQWVAASSPVPPPLSVITLLRALLFGLVALLVPLLWRGGVSRKAPHCGWLALVLLVVGAGEWALRRPFCQTPLWLAARSRLAAGEYFMSEVCYVRLEEAAGRETSSPAVILVGSSQMLNGVDEQLLRRRLSPMAVIRRSMFGLSPLKALAMWAYLPLQPGDFCVQYLSEFDFTLQDPFPADWFRPFASWETCLEVWRCLPTAQQWWHWRQGVDYAMAATFEGWRARDFFRRILFNFWGKTPPGEKETGPNSSVEAQKLAEQLRNGLLEISSAEQEAFTHFRRRVAQTGSVLVVFEGDVNPMVHSPERMRVRQQIREFLRPGEGGPAYRFISLAEQGLPSGPQYWRDLTHLNSEGRRLLTETMAEKLLALAGLSP